MKVTHNVVVSKAVPTMAGESLREFTMKLCSGAKEYIRKSLNMAEKDASMYAIDVFEGAAIFDVYMYKSEGGAKMEYYSLKYSRKDGGAFEFSGLEKVKPVTSYVKDDSVGVMKRWEPAVGFWSGAEL